MRNFIHRRRNLYYETVKYFDNSISFDGHCNLGKNMNRNYLKTINGQFDEKFYTPAEKFIL